MTGIKVPLSIKIEILKFVFHDMESGFYKDRVDSSQVFELLKKWLAKNEPFLELDGDDNPVVSIANDSRYIEIGFNGHDGHGKFYTITIMSELNPDEGESYDEFTSIYTIDRYGEEVTL